MADGDDEIQIETDERIYVSVDGLTADYTELHFVVLKQREDFSKRLDLSKVTAFQNESAFMGPAFSG